MGNDTAGPSQVDLDRTHLDRRTGGSRNYPLGCLQRWLILRKDLVYDVRLFSCRSLDTRRNSGSACSHIFKFLHHTNWK